MAIAIRRQNRYEVIIMLSSAVISHLAASRSAGAEEIVVTSQIFFYFLLFDIILRQLLVFCDFFIRASLVELILFCFTKCVGRGALERMIAVTDPKYSVKGFSFLANA